MNPKIPVSKKWHGDNGADTQVRHHAVEEIALLCEIGLDGRDFSEIRLG